MLRRPMIAWWHSAENRISLSFEVKFEFSIILLLKLEMFWNLPKVSNKLNRRKKKIQCNEHFFFVWFKNGWADIWWLHCSCSSARLAHSAEQKKKNDDDNWRGLVFVVHPLLFRFSLFSTFDAYKNTYPTNTDDVAVDDTAVAASATMIVACDCWV